MNPVLPDLSIVILTWNSRAFLAGCLASLPEAAALTRHEVIVVDNGSTDETAAWVRALGRPEIILLCNAKNRGVAPARNQGLAAASGELVLLLDVDTVARPGAIDAMARFMRRHPRVGIVGPRLVSPTGHLQHSCRRFPTLIGKAARRLGGGWGRTVLAADEYREWDHGAPGEVDYVIGAAQMIRRQVIAQIGPLDGHMFYGPEDVDYCLRAWQAGWPVVYFPGAEFVHHEQRITRRLWSRITWLHALALVRYFRKHGAWLSRGRLYRRLGRDARPGVRAAPRLIT